MCFSIMPSFLMITEHYWRLVRPNASNIWPFTTMPTLPNLVTLSISERSLSYHINLDFSLWKISFSALAELLKTFGFIQSDVCAPPSYLSDLFSFVAVGWDKRLVHFSNDWMKDKINLFVNELVHFLFLKTIWSNCFWTK